MNGKKARNLASRIMTLKNACQARNRNLEDPKSRIMEMFRPQYPKSSAD